MAFDEGSQRAERMVGCRKWGGVVSRAGADLAALTAMIRPALPARRVIGVSVVNGGLANENLRLRLDGPPDDVRLRLFRRDPQQAAKEAALYRCLASGVPVPRLLHVGADNPLTGEPYAVLDWIDGERLEQVAPRLDAEAASRLARAVGRVLAAIHAVTFSEDGFLDARLEVAGALPAGSLADYLDSCLADGQGRRRLGPDLADAARALAARDGHRFDAWPGGCLVHGDFGGSNILVCGSVDRPAVAAVLDWEFAFSGSPAHDFGNLLRPPLGDIPGFEDSVAEGYVGGGGWLPPDWRRLSLLADLTAWAELMTRPAASDALVADARAMVSRTIAAFPPHEPGMRARARSGRWRPAPGRGGGP